VVPGPEPGRGPIGDCREARSRADRRPIGNGREARSKTDRGRSRGPVEARPTTDRGSARYLAEHPGIHAALEGPGAPPGAAARAPKKRSCATHRPVVAAVVQGEHGRRSVGDGRVGSTWVVGQRHRRGRALTSRSLAGASLQLIPRPATAAAPGEMA